MHAHFYMAEFRLNYNGCETEVQIKNSFMRVAVPVFGIRRLAEWCLTVIPSD